MLKFPEEEEKVLRYWSDIDAFKTSLKLTEGNKPFTFYDGPPFATGLPHYGHLLAGSIKDIVLRYATMQGHYVERRFGWDCHGLPVEFEIDKKLKIQDRQQVLDMGIDKYNAECRAIVMRYSNEWKETVTRIGRWIDMDNDYKTLNPTFMESVWWVFQQLFNKNQVYRGFRIMPYSTGCHTPLSNFEANQNYKDAADPAVTVSFPLVEDPSVSFLAWTTTPWTLPSNMSLCVHPDFDYVKILDGETGSKYILLEKRLDTLYKNVKKADFKILEKFKGSTLAGKRYIPLYDYFKSFSDRGSFTVVCDTYVTDDSGVGIVHNAPGFGEDDYRVCLKHGMISEVDVPCPVDDAGRFTSEITEFAGIYVKDADKLVIKDLKNRGRLVRHAQITHSYPFCWRSDTPLIYKAVPSWFVRVADIVPQLLKNNKQSFWVPDNVKEKRFGNWLENARDWNISRNRFWGTPIPLWTNEDFSEVVCVGSISELESLTGASGVTDLHRDSIDKLQIPSKKTPGSYLKRIDEVFDCWFESGSMPYASKHYPFEGKEEFDKGFPADFIAEGLDQTRGWFYTLLVLSTHLFDSPPAKNVIVNGLVLAGDGKKMSKRLKNYPEPSLILNKYGADALRLTLINSPVVRAEPMRFKEESVRETLAKVFIPWYNCYRFFQQQVDLLLKESEVAFVYDPTCKYENVMDQWILANTQSLVKFVQEEMAGYRLYTVVPRLLLLIDNLTNWYVRFNRRRMKGENSVSDAQKSLNALFAVLFTLCKCMAPFCPFASEMIYQHLKPMMNADAFDSSLEKDVRSVHFLRIPKPIEAYYNADIERQVARMQAVIEQGRQMRDKRTIPLKTPLSELVVVSADEQYRLDVEFLSTYIKEELNVVELFVTDNEAEYGIQKRLNPDHKALGQRLKKQYTAVRQLLTKLALEDTQSFIANKKLILNGVEIFESELSVVRYVDVEADGGVSGKYETSFDNEAVVLLNVTLDDQLLEQGMIRELVNRVQRLRKKAGLVQTDDVIYYFKIKEDPDQRLTALCKSQAETIRSALKQPFMNWDQKPLDKVIIEEDQMIGDLTFALSITRP